MPDNNNWYNQYKTYAMRFEDEMEISFLNPHYMDLINFMTLSRSHFLQPKHQYSIEELAALYASRAEVNPHKCDPLEERSSMFRKKIIRRES